MAPAADKKVTGLVAATFTPFTTQGEIDTSVIGPYIDYLLEKQGIKSIFVNGTTGESMSLTVAERKVLAEEWCQKAKGRMDQVIVHVGCMSVKDSQDLARHAAQIGADGIAVIAPFFFKPRTAETLRAFMKEVASAAPNLPFYYYQIPGLTGVHVNVRDVIEGIEDLIPSFRGVKFTGSDLMDFGQCVSNCQPEWSVLYGVDEQLLAGLAMGAHGAVGSTYNYIGCHVNKLLSAFEKGDLVQARSIQFKMQELLSYAMKLGFDVGVNKQLMSELSGLSLGPPRLPLTPCPHDRIEQITQKYRTVF
ncbi:N-acetylneuraminate lyase [Austrofundulus limnaeus]|uniref:N-acetylneuraminate lyase n=1 Tax=Austrofundulus limnaeus TaxID=52670 RepID=A0A2I4AX74_AUSLI|nr:PREDICTED: N-acetylneuraminate lyase [Austrofundulus limnaeus]XP_013860108.1 PREDICTED: N-acetylneuraminate lyase [Austrofundulus limnaeus]XP_013860109.1 PREDICTED: N-acetylneuraminate lyase [Austrofundulus limnaeus]